MIYLYQKSQNNGYHAYQTANRTKRFFIRNSEANIQDARFKVKFANDKIFVGEGDVYWWNEYTTGLERFSFASQEEQDLGQPTESTWVYVQVVPKTGGSAMVSVESSASDPLSNASDTTTIRIIAYINLSVTPAKVVQLWSNDIYFDRVS